MCDSVSCYVMGADGLCAAVEVHLGVKLGETTDDNRSTLLPIVCLGACDKAPTMMIDDGLIGAITPERLGEIFDRFE